MSDGTLHEWQEYDSRIFEGSSASSEPAARESSEAYSGPFLLGNDQSIHLEAGYEAEGLTDQAETSEVSELEASAAELEASVAPEAPSASEQAMAMESNGKSATHESFEIDPYVGIRPVMAPEHADLAANEISLVLGPMPATIVLHQMLNSPEMRMATLGSFLGKAARRTIRFHGREISIPSYLRLISRLSREVAEQSEAEIGESEVSEGERSAAVAPGGKYFIKIDRPALVVRAWLFDFDKNQARLKRGHIELLKSAIGPA